VNTLRYQILVKDRAGVQKSLIGAGARRPALIACEFDTLDNGGCNELSMELDRDRIDGTIQIGYLVTFSAQVIGGALTDYWHGVITSAPKPGHTGRVWRYEARGLLHELERQRIVKYYEGKDIDDLVIDLLADVDTPVTAISASTSEISIAAPYNVADYEVEFERADDIIAQLALMQGNVQYGVDQAAKLYFKDVTAAVIAGQHYWVGKHVTSLSVEETLDRLVNDVYSQSKYAVGGGGLTLHRENAASKTAYGNSTQVVQVRNTGDPADVARYADSIIARSKDPKRIVSANIPSFSGFVFPRGQVRITDKDAVAYNFPVKRVAYRLDPNVGLIGSMEIGDILVGTYEEKFAETVRRVERSNSNAISLTRIEHTRGEEFAQRAIVNARKNGKLNVFTDPMSDIKALDPILSQHLELRDRYLFANFDYSYSIAVSRPIPTGEEVSTARLHIDYDLEGKIRFERDDDITTFFEGASTEKYRIRPDGLGVHQYAIGGIVFYKDQSADVPAGQIGYFLPAYYRIRAQIDFLASNMTGASSLIFAYIDNNNRCQVEIQNNASNMRFRLYTRVAGVDTLRETINLTKDTNYFVEAIYDDVANTVQMIIYDKEDGTALGTSAAYTFSFANGTVTKAGLGAFYNATDQSTFCLRSWAVSTKKTTTWSTAPSLYVQRGNTYNETLGSGALTVDGAIVNGIQHFSVNLAGAPSGTNLWVKIQFVHPTRIYGWGISF